MFRSMLTTAMLLGLTATAMAQTPKVVSLESGTVTKQDTLSAKFNGTALLQAFKLRYTRDDHHIRTLGVLPGRNRVTALFADKNGDDAFQWSARFVTLNHPGIVLGEVSGELELGSATRLLDKPAGDFLFVLRGFKFNYGQNRVGYGGKDHHIDEIGITEFDGKLDVRFNDKNDDDPFTYHVKYAYIPKHLMTGGIAVLSGSSIGEGAARGSSKGIPVLQGFRFNFDKSDHHLRQIGVDARGPNLAVSFFDKNKDDRFRWNANLAYLGSAQPTPTSSKTSPYTSSKISRTPVILKARINKK